jgi:hypothetical protein
MSECKGCNGYGFTKSMNLCVCCHGSGTDSESAYDSKEIIRSTRDLLIDLPLNEIIYNFVSKSPITIPNEDTDFYGMIKSIRSYTDHALVISVDILIRVDPPLRICSTTINRPIRNVDLMSLNPSLNRKN